MTDRKNKAAAPIPDTALEATAINYADSTDHDLQALVKQAVSVTDDEFESEAACKDFMRRIAELGAPQVSLREIGQYELIEQLGAGGMGEVWKARHKKLDRTVALKLLHPRISQSEGAAARFEQEMRAIGALQHENIVQALDAGEVDGVLYLTMEHVEGRVLSDVLTDFAKRGKQLSWAKACVVIRQAAAGLQFAHESGIVHRDIKPSNIMVTPKGEVKLLDMGLARLANSDSPMPELTAEGQVMGTLDYMPPEQLRDSRTADVPADIYALGATFYKLVTGRAPFADEKTNSVESKILAIATEKPVPVTELREDVPPELSQLIDEMLWKEPGERPASANEVIKRVNQIAAGLVQSKDDTQTTISAAPRAKPLPSQAEHTPARVSKKHWVIGAVILGLALFGGILLTLKDPVHGDLVIDGPEGVTIKATKIDDPSESYTFKAGEDESSLTKGQWKITIVGEGFDELTIEDDVVRINGPEGAVVRISERPPVDDPSTDPKGTANLKGDKIAAVDPPKLTDRHVRDRLNKIDWDKLEAPTSMQGYAVTPASIPGIPTAWQVVPTFCHHVARDILLSPKATYVVAVHDPGSDPYLRVNNRMSGAIACCVQIGGSTGIQHYSFSPGSHVAFSPDETQFAVLLSWDRSVVRVYDIQGIMRAEWESKSAFGSIRWSPDGTRLLLNSGTQLEQRTPAGDIAETFTQPQGKTFGAVEWSPSGETFAVIADGKVLVCNKNGGEPIATLEGPDGLKLQTCRWHPLEKKILTNGPPGRGAEASALLWTLSGEYLQFDTKRLHEEFVGFSPDGQFLVTNYGDVRDQTNAVISTFDMTWAGYIQVQEIKFRWPESDRFVLASSQRGAGYSVEYAPSGRLLRRNEHPAPLPQQSATFRVNDIQSMGSYRKSGTLQSDWMENSSNWLVPAGSEAATAFASFSPSGSFAMHDTPGSLRVHSPDGQLQYHLRSGHPRLLSWNRDGTLLAQGDTWAEKNKVLVWKEQQLVATLDGVHAEDIRGLVWSETTDLLLVWDGALNVCVWDPQRPKKPLVRTKGYGFKCDRYNNHWSFDKSCPKWSPDGKSIAVPTEDEVVIFSVASGEPTSRITWARNQIGSIWWRQDSQRLLLKNRIVDLDGTVVGSVEELKNRSLLDLDWDADGIATGVGHRFVAFWNKLADKPKVIQLPGFNYVRSPQIGLRSRGMNSQNVSADGRFLLHQSGVTASSPNSGRNGDIHLIDIKNQKHLWTGLAFTDGTQIKIAPTGQVLSDIDNLERYLTYIIRYNNRRILTLTPAQFAARVGLSESHQLAQRVLDLGGSIRVTSREQPLTAANVPVATELPPVADVVGIEAVAALDDLAGIGGFTSLRHLNLSGSAFSGDASYRQLGQLKELRTLNLAGIEISNGISSVLPTSLEELDLSETNVGDFLLADLAEFKSLKTLRAVGTKVTDAGVARLQEALPGCRITSR